MTVSMQVSLYLLILTNAFDTVDHKLLFYKVNCYEIRGHVNNFFYIIHKL